MHTRKFDRADYNIAGDYTPAEGAGKKFLFHVLNISLKGILVEMKEIENRELHEMGHVELFLPNSDIKLTANTKIAHIENNHIGFEIEEIDLDSMTHLRKILEYNTGNPSEIEHELFFLKHED